MSLKKIKEFHFCAILSHWHSLRTAINLLTMILKEWGIHTLNILRLYYPENLPLNLLFIYT